MARNGKIARLPLHIRTELNRRLQEGEAGTSLVQWLNRLPAVRAALREYFGGVPISIQNLSEWRQGGYQDWLRLEAARDFIDNLSEQSGELDEAAGGELISDRFGSVLAAEMAQLAMKFLEQEDDLEKRWNRLKEINREFSRMRRDDHRGLRAWIKRAQWEQQQEREEEEAEEKIRRQERVAAFFGGPSGRAPGPKAEGRMQKAEVSGNASGTPALRGESGQIKPNQTKSRVKLSATSPRPSPPFHGGEGETLPASGHELTSSSRESERAKPNQESEGIKLNPTKSNQNCDEAGVTIKVEGAGFKIEGLKPDEGPPEPQGGGQSRGSEPDGLPNRGGGRGRG
jgi:hypothetical protein